MLITVGSARSSDEGPQALLLACHERIRRFTAMAARMVRQAGFGGEEVAAAASALVRYHTIALPLHQADEEASIAPRLGALQLGDDVGRAIDLMTAQHVALERVIGQLVPHWEALSRDPGRLGELSDTLRPWIDELEPLWLSHLTLEEETLFPLLATQVSPEEQRAVLAEMRARRGYGT
jgi:hypothetical protein